MSTNLLEQELCEVLPEREEFGRGGGISLTNNIAVVNVVQLNIAVQVGSGNSSWQASWANIAVGQR
ncbi:MAG: hypothetical protein ACKVWR_12450 [Acidimicrobiales bacterium]